ncbi:MAG: SLC13 family permease [Xanthomonadales bacterium]|nr:SLC13 family permease [Gammaproteobacteria bacterium]MBT8072212.1 SLC13 family permease [Gammaproteobacteria bacterium]NNK03053.1 SLC13 family permease [Xanthomonadales bacterium]
MDFPQVPNTHALVMLIMTGVALFLFSREKIHLESSSLAILVMVVIGFEIFPFEGVRGAVEPMHFFHGFGHEALVAVCALMVAGEALVRTGALEPITRRLARLWKWSPKFALLLTLLVGAVLSAFMNNTPIVVLMIPMLIGAAIRSNSPVSGVLLPMGLATLIGGMGTTIGTSTNLLVVSVAADMGMVRFEMFDFVMPVVIAGGVAILYLWLVAPLMVPERKSPMLDISKRVFQAHLLIPANNPLIGKSLADLIHKAGNELPVKRVVRDEHRFISPLPDVEIEAGDRIHVSGTVDMLREYEALLGARLLAGLDSLDSLVAGDFQLAEVVVTGGSRLRGMKVADARLKGQYGLDLLAVHCGGDSVVASKPELDHLELQASDVLLVQGDSEDIRRLKTGSELLLLDSTADLPRSKKAPLALMIMVAIIALAAFGVMPIAMSAVLGCLVLIGTGCLRWQQANRALSAQVILIIVASLALGSALMITGGADYLAQVFLYLTHGLAPAWVLSFLMLLMAVLTNVVSNNAAAVIGTPIAISIAQELGLPLEPFVLAVLFGANLSFVTPMAYKTNLLVMNAGGYKFNDFVRVGTPLTLLMWVVLSLVLTFAYQL